MTERFERTYLGSLPEQCHMSETERVVLSDGTGRRHGKLCPANRHHCMRYRSQLVQ